MAPGLERFGSHTARLRCSFGLGKAAVTNPLYDELAGAIAA
jgi:hypothetical protein